MGEMKGLNQFAIASSLWIVLIYNPLAAQQNLGTAPQANLDAADLYSVFHLPVSDSPGTPAGDAALGLQVGMRAQKLGLTAHSAYVAWTVAQTLLARPVPAPSFSPASFTGGYASGLNTFIANSSATYIRVTSDSIELDQPIRINREGVTIDLGAAQIASLSSQPYMVRIEGVHNVILTGGSFTSGNSAILVSKSVGVIVDHTQISGLSGDGIVVTGSSHVMVTHNRISGLGGPGVVIGAGTSLSTVDQNDISNGTGASNWAAGIVVSDRDLDLASNPGAIFGAGGYGPPAEPIFQRLNAPRDSLIAFNHVATNVSSGIYMDGGVRITIFSSTIQGNAKEGMCLDNGATANVVTSNVIQQNGKRWGQTDAVLQLDFVGGRLPDGTAAAKLPGISIDNAMYNVVFANNVSHNFGGGIKMVRTGYFNVLAFNIVDSDNDGVNAYFRFFGIQLGAAPSDVPSPDLDFTGSRGNVVFSNLIRGSNASGIFIQAGSDQNNMIENVIMDAGQFAIESVLHMSNFSRDNWTNLPSQNITNGCCSLETGRPPARRAVLR